MLVGLHSYASGEGIGKFPTWLTWTILFLGLLTSFAAFRNESFKKTSKNTILFKAFSLIEAALFKSKKDSSIK
jgi:uncharacterized membrane protein